MKTDVIVIRHPCAGAPHFLTRATNAIILNAGDGSHEHPTQGLLDMYTMWERWGDLKGKRVVIVGDVLHSRVARSNIWGLMTMGAQVAVCGPATLIPEFVRHLGIQVYTDIDKALSPGADAINCLRIQKERQSSDFLPSMRGIRVCMVSTPDAPSLRPGGLIMHPGPMNRVEITSDVADGPVQSFSIRVTNGLAFAWPLFTCCVRRSRAVEGGRHMIAREAYRAVGLITGGRVIDPASGFDGSQTSISTNAESFADRQVAFRAQAR
jgi:aspartate carbamoyltransferase catalytic subunit